jgi:hypothetical protein
MTEDEKDFEEWFFFDDWLSENYVEEVKPVCKYSSIKGRRTLREKIKSDPSIGKLVVEGEWPESPDY